MCYDDSSLNQQIFSPAESTDSQPLNPHSHGRSARPQLHV